MLLTQIKLYYGSLCKDLDLKNVKEIINKEIYDFHSAANFVDFLQVNNLTMDIEGEEILVVTIGKERKILGQIISNWLTIT